MKSTRTAKSDQIENPMCSENTENHRLRFATFFPVACQKDSSSGRHSSIQRPRRSPPEAGAATLIRFALSIGGAIRSHTLGPVRRATLGTVGYTDVSPRFGHATEKGPHITIPGGALLRAGR